MARLGLTGGQHPAGLFYNTKSIRQELERITGGWRKGKDEPMWPVNAGWAHPFKDVTKHFAEPEELRKWSDELDEQADQLFLDADVVVVTLGLIETWRNPTTKHTFRQIPHPEGVRSRRRRVPPAHGGRDGGGPRCDPSARSA